MKRKTTKKNKTLVVELKNIGDTASIVHGGKIAFVTVDYDQDAENPLESCEAMGTIYSFSRRHVNFKDPSEVFEDMYAEDKVLCEDYKDAVFLAYYEHGLCNWAVAGVMNAGNTHHFDWDCVKLAGVWVPDKCLLEEAKDLTGEDRRKKMVEWAGQACAVYTSWCNGECYGYKVAAYKLRKAEGGELYDQEDDYRHDEPLTDDSCWGYIGSDDLNKYMLPECVAPILTRVFGRKVEVTY